MILITGTTGFLGSHLALHLLEQGKMVRGIYRHPDNRNRTRELFDFYGKGNLYDKIDWKPADVNDLPLLENAFLEVNEVYHCAALISFDSSREEELRKINIEGTANVVNLALKNKVQRFCHFSSIAALGDAVMAGDIVDEETPWNQERAHSDYAISKYGGELEVWRGHQEGLKVVVLVPGVIVGPVPNLKTANKDGLASIYNAVRQGFPFYTNGTTGVIAVNDLVGIAFALMQGDAVNQRLIAICANMEMRSIAIPIAKGFSVRPPRFKAGKTMLKIAVTMDWFFHCSEKKKIVP